MTEIPEESRSEYSPTSLAFWLAEARTLKETADLSWQADLNTMQRVKLIYGQRHDRVLRHTTEELGVELNLLYRYLISLAIQYLAIGLLLVREPDYFLQRQPGHRIVTLLQAGGVELTPQQQRLLAQTESAYEWADRFPFGNLGDSHDELRHLSYRLSQVDSLNSEEKRVLDELYGRLEGRAEKLL